MIMHDATFPPHDAPAPDLDYLVQKVQAGDSFSVDELHRLLSPGVRFFIERALDDRFVDQATRAVLGEVTKAIRDGSVRDPRLLLGHVRRTVQVHLDHEDAAHGRPTQAPLAVRQAASLAQAMSAEERELVRRFYVLGQSESQIVSEMQLSAEQFRLLKSAARRRTVQQTA